MKTTAKTFTELAQILAKKQEIKVTQYYGIEYNPQWVYIPRIYANNKDKAKVRVLKQGDNVKNCLKITFNPERYTRKDIERIINNNIPVIKNQLHGTCQTFLRINDLLEVLTGILGRNGLPTNNAKNLLNINL